MLKPVDLPLIVRDLKRQDYEPVWEAMKRFTDARDETTPDELWVLEHNPVFTLGQAGKREHLLAPGNIEVVKSDRGGQVTYHGPGQQIVYLLINLRRIGLGVRDLVTLIETSLIDYLADCGVESVAKPDAPGVYVGGDKIASLGLRVRRGCSYHGLSFNLDMDLEPFSRINVCGYRGLQVTQLVNLMENVDKSAVRKALVTHIAGKLGYTEPLWVDHWPPELEVN